MAPKPVEARQLEPFLGYHSDSDDPDKEEARNFRHISPARGNLLLYIVICFATSLFWAGLFYLFHADAPSAVMTSSPPDACPVVSTTTTTTTATSSSSSSPVGATVHSPTGGERHNVTTGARLLTCGTSLATARAVGCRYDPLLSAWVPAPCYDQEFIDRYVRDGTWGGFADEALTQRLSAEQMSERDHFFTTLGDHAHHCAVMWRKQFWALFEESRAFDTIVASILHTDRCAQFLIDVGERNWTQPAKVDMGFAGCWVRDDRLGL